MFKVVVVNGFSKTFNTETLKADLEKDGHTFESLSLDGELIIVCNGIRELWQAMPEGGGTNNTVWGDHAPGYEFVRAKY